MSSLAVLHGSEVEVESRSLPQPRASRGADTLGVQDGREAPHACSGDVVAVGTAEPYGYGRLKHL